MKPIVTKLKALADTNRLTILALLAQAPHSGDELAALLDLNPSTVSHHLTRLQKAGLVSATAEQYYHLYQLKPAALAELAGALTPETLANLVQQQATVDPQAYRAQSLARWIDEDRLQALPTPRKQRAVVLAWLADKFAPDQRYAAQQVDDVLNRWCNWQESRRLDIATVTRALVAENVLQRTRDGYWYWRADSPRAQGNPNFTPEQLPQADTSNLHVPLPASPLRQCVKLAMCLKANQSLSAEEVDAVLIKQGIAAESVADVRATLVAAGLLTQPTTATYLRPTIGPDHPTAQQLRAEALSVAKI